MSVDDAFQAYEHSTNASVSAGVLVGLDPALTQGGRAASSRGPPSTPQDAEKMNVNDGDFIRQLVKDAEDTIVDAERAGRDAARRIQDLNEFNHSAHSNPHASALEELEAQLSSESESLKERVEHLEVGRDLLSTAQAADTAFSTKGIQSYLFEGALGRFECARPDSTWTR